MRVALEKFPLIYKECAFGKRYRSSFEITASILEVAVEGASRFVIASHLNTSYAQLQRYLNYLVRMGFIDVKANGKQILYKTCEKGLKFLRLYHALLEMFLENTETQTHVGVVCRCVNPQTIAKAKGRGRRVFGL